jgi:hypothetical protein
LILKIATIIDGGLLQDAAQMELAALSAIHSIAEPWIVTTPTTIKKCFVKCGFSIDEKDDWPSLHSPGVQSVDYPTCDSATEVCGVQSINHVLHQRLIWPEEEEEVAKHKATFLDAKK